MASESINLFRGWNFIVWPNVLNKSSLQVPSVCQAVQKKSSVFNNLFVFVPSQNYYLKCRTDYNWNLSYNLDSNYTYQLSPGSGVAPLNEDGSWGLDIYLNSSGASTNNFQVEFNFDSNEVELLGGDAISTLYHNANGAKGYNSYFIISTTAATASKVYSIEKIGSMLFKFKSGITSAIIRFNTSSTYVKGGDGQILPITLPSNFQYVSDSNVTPRPYSTPSPGPTAGPTQSPGPTPSPCAGGGTFDGNVVRNYIHYADAGTDYNALYPNGAPYGVIGIFAWSAIHTGNGTFNWAPIDNYIQTATCTNKSVMIKILSYESDLPTLGNWEFSSPYQCPCPAGKTCLLSEPEDAAVATSVYHIYSDMTPAWVKNQIGSIYVPLAGQDMNNNGVVDAPDIKRCRPRKSGGDIAPAPNFCYTVAAIPKYNDPLYQTALRQFIEAFGARYKNNNKVSGILFGIGLDNEFGEWTKGAWGDCYVKDETQKLGLMNSNLYLSTFVSSTGQDYTDWYANAFYPKPVFHGVTSEGKERMPTMFAKGHSNLGIHQASLEYDHNWFMHYGTGILEIAVAARDQGYPVMFENARPINALDYPWENPQQRAYSEMLAMLFTFPKYFDWVQGLCMSYPNQCKWAKQYYSRTPQNTDDVWIEFQETIYPPRSGYSGWREDYEYGLKRVSAKGTTIWRQSFNDPDGNEQMAGHPEAGLLQLFNSTVANSYTGQARKVNVNETMILAPYTAPTVWKGISGSGPFSYKVYIYYIDNGTGTVKVEVGNDTDGYNSQQWDRTNTIAWQTKELNFSGKKAAQIKITPTSGDPLYLHMVRVSLPGSTVWDLRPDHTSP